jgi:aldehyde:ferredoxin oxidoreductase
MHNIHDSLYQTDNDIKGLHAMGLLEPLRFDDLGPAKVRMAKQVINLGVARNCIGLCAFLPAGAGMLAEIVSAVTGWDFSVFELLEVGERAMALGREFNRRCGQTAADDVPPRRFFEPMGKGQVAGGFLEREKFAEALALYYDMMGWDHQTGAPLDWKLAELGLDWVVAERKRST